MRLNRWQRLGVVLSIIWAFSAAIHQRNADVERAEDFANFAYRVCADSKALKPDVDVTNCERERERNVATWLKGSWGNMALVALVPIPLGWFAVFVLIYTGRAAVIGFRAVVPWAAMTLPRKAFVVFSVLASLTVILFGITVVLNLYVDTRVPVSMGPAMVIQTGEDRVMTKGTWTREGLTKGSETGFPLQTSRITCYRSERRCLEARASVSFGNLLDAELIEYEIESWSATTIVFKSDGLCVSEVFTIDRKTETVNGIGRRTNKDKVYCKQFQSTENKEDRWNYHLTNGFDVYWEQRKKARPLPLRLIQTFFGN